MKKIVIFTLFLCLSCSPYFRGEGEEERERPIGKSLYTGLDELASQMMASMVTENVQSVAVIDFSDLDGRVSTLGQYISEKLIAKLFESKKFKVIERKLLDKVLTEYQLSQAGLTDPNLARQLGQLLGVEAIVSGTIADLGGGFDVNARMIDTQTGRVFAVASVIIAKDSQVRGILGLEPEPGLEKPKPEEREHQRPFEERFSSRFSSAIAIDTGVGLKLEPIYEYARKTYDLEIGDKYLIWKNFSERNDVAYIHKSGKILLFSEKPILSQNDMDIFRNEYITIIDNISKVNVDMDEEVRNQAWNRALTVYNYERNTYKRIVGKPPSQCIISIPRLTIKQASLFIWAKAWTTRILIDNQELERWNGENSKTIDVTNLLYYGDHTFEIKQFGGAQRFISLEFYLESSPLSILMTDRGRFNLRDKTPCYAMEELRLPK